MGVASHLGIDLTEYDSRIRTFIPHYEEMLDVAAAAIPPRARAIVDLGVGTGALSARCLATAGRAMAVGIDVDPEILALAKRRLGGRAAFTTGSFLRAPLPACDAVVASFALHHVRTRAAKASLYQRVHTALRPGGVFLSVDSNPGSEPSVRRAQFDEWMGHLRQTYSAAGLRRSLRRGRMKTCACRSTPIALLRSAGFRVEVLWREAIRRHPGRRSFQTKIAG
jgi:tRNA (cmo5U34)-methyltransferase